MLPGGRGAESGPEPSTPHPVTSATCAACYQVAEELTAKDVIRAHARDELGIDIDDMSNPTQAAVVSLVAFTIGAALPLLAGSFISGVRRLACYCLFLPAGCTSITR